MKTEGVRHRLQRRTGRIQEVKKKKVHERMKESEEEENRDSRFQRNREMEKRRRI
jgi:uncharacterized protein (UPF0305 family)